MHEMRRRSRASVLVAATIGATAGGPWTAAAQVAGGPRGSAAFEAELMAVDRAFNDATQASGVEGWLSYFEAQGSMIQPAVGEIRGLGAIREAMGSLADPRISLTWEPIRAQGSADGTLGYTVGRYLSRVDLGGSPTESRGLYVTIWRRQPDGGLKAVMDLGNPVDP